MAHALSVRSAFEQYAKTATDQNVWFNWSAIDDRSYMRCKKCSAVRIFTMIDLSANGQTISQELQDWIKGHRHDKAQVDAEQALKMQIRQLANSATGQRNNLQDLQLAKEKLINMIEGDKPKVQTVPSPGRRKFR